MCKGEVAPFEALRRHHAQRYLLATSTRPSSSIAKALKGVNDEPNSTLRATCWNVSDLTLLLLKPENQDLLRQFFPASQHEFGGVSANSDFESLASQAQSLELSLPTPELQELFMVRFYLACDLERGNSTFELALRRRLFHSRIQLRTSMDQERDLLWSPDGWPRYLQELERAEAAFGLADPQACQHPRLWMEVEAARERKILQTVFIHEDIFTLTRFRGFPVCLFDDREDWSVHQYIEFYKHHRHMWASKAESFLWLGLALLASYFERGK